MKPTSTNERRIYPNSVVSLPSGIHQLRSVRRREHVTIRTMSKRLHATISQVNQQECETSDILISTLLRWAAALELPPAELLGEVSPRLPPDLALRAKIIRVVKTARAIQDRAQTTDIEYLANEIMHELLEMCPELHDVTAWPRYGSQVSRFGRAILVPVDTNDISIDS